MLLTRNIMYKFKLTSVLSIVAVSIMAITFTGCESDGPKLVPVSADAISEENEVVYSDTVFVHISGAVCTPGVYELEKGSRLYDVVSLAGGFTEDADTEYANLAEVLNDGEKYVIYTRDEVERFETGDSNLSVYTSDGLLDINLASKEDFMELEGIGASKAQAIINYRDEHGEFSCIEDIKNVSGIGDGIYSRIQTYITVR